MSERKSRAIVVQGAPVALMTRHEADYISLTDVVRNFDGAGALIEQWLKAKDTVLFLGIWEQLNNAGFNSLEFEGIRNEAGRNSFFLSVKKWVQGTGAIGLFDLDERDDYSKKRAANYFISRCQQTALLVGAPPQPCSQQDEVDASQ